MIKRVPRADGDRWQAYGRRDGKKVYVGTYDSEKAAKLALEEHRVTTRKIDAGELPPEVDERLALNVAVEKWLASLEKNGSRSHRAYAEFMRYQVLPTLGPVAIARITKARVLAWRDSLTSEYSARTVNSALGALSAAFASFVDRGLVPSNPCRGVKLLEVLDRDYNWLKTRAELERLLLNCADELRDMVAVAIGTGMRLDELLHLAWDDVDLQARLITVQRGRQGTVKSGRLRHVPILDAVLPVLQARHLKRGGSFLVFPGKGGEVRAKTPVQCAYKAALKRAGLDTRLRWHDLRHTCASWWVISGGDIFRLSRLLGHSSVQITQRTYAHLAPDAWQQDYHRLAFHVPHEPAKVVAFVSGERGKLAGRRALEHRAAI